MREAVIVSTARTPIGKAYRGAFNNTHGATMGGHVIKHAVERAQVEMLQDLQHLDDHGAAGRRRVGGDAVATVVAPDRLVTHGLV